MNKYFRLLLTVLVLSISFSGCVCDKKEKEDQINSIEEAMKTGKIMKCTYNMTQSDENYSSTIWIQGEKYKTEYEQSGNKMYSLFDGKIIYSWPIEAGKGYKIDKDCLEEIKDITSENNNSDTFSIDETFTTEDDLKTAANVKCEYTDNIDMNIPDNIEFTDQCELMKQAIDAFNKLDDTMKDLNL